MAKYSIGVDFGSLSGRALLVNVETGEEVAAAVKEYTHGVMSERLPCGKKLGEDWALQHPDDYLEVFGSAIPAVIKQSGIDVNDVVGVGIDFTACTVLPVLSDGTPLCALPEYKSNPHAYVKLWKHHAAQAQANTVNETARKTGETFLERYGGKISSEWEIPKALQIAQDAPEIYKRADKFIEAADWVVWKLTGKETRNSCTAGYKGLWSKKEGYPSKKFFKALDPLMENFVEQKIGCPITPIGDKAGEIDEFASRLTGLKKGTAVAVANVDAHVALPAVGVTDAGKMLMIMGTSTCDIFLGTTEKNVPGMCGVVEDGVLPGFFGYESGQSCVGDHFDWFVKTCVPPAYFDEANKRNQNIHAYLVDKASGYAPGESGLLALDWWNGNRSVLVDVDLTGMMLGMTLATRPEEMYRALIEATAYGKRMIIETFEKNGVRIDELYAAGGIAEKNPMMMQIYADVTKKEIKLSGSPQACALGSAIFGAAASGYIELNTAIRNMSKLKDIVYKPLPKNAEIYDKLYAEFERLHDYFGRGENNVMKSLKKIKAEAEKC
ncbi:MAG: ribulokinase [Clostridiales bacterium]|jgi:L-ribulokinase|nr:ribulokinase [Clostridiales bacterium]